MASFVCEEDGMLRIPASSPCRRDYQLRSLSSAPRGSEGEVSRPLSPWQPRAEPRSKEADTFRLDDCSVDWWHRYGGSLPPASRSFYSGPLPSASPMPSFFGSGALPDFLADSAASEQSPEGGSSFREEEGDDVDEVGEVLYSSYLRRKGEERSTRKESPSPVNLVRTRNCVSGELGRRFELARHRSQAARGHRSGEIVELSADGMFRSPDMRSEVAALVKVGREISKRKQISSESVASEVTHAHAHRSPELAMVAVSPSEPASSASAMVEIPFKREEMPVKHGESSGNAHSLITSERKVAFEPSSGATQASVSERAAPATMVKSSSLSSSVSSSRSRAKNGVSLAVPFKWEVEPGRPKVEDKAVAAAAAPALQLPPRLASASSSRRNSSCSASAPPSRRNSSATAGSRPRPPSRSLSASVAQLPHDENRSPARPRRSLATVFQSGPVDTPCTPKRAFSEYLSEDAASWSRARSPTSTLCGPGVSNPSSCQSDKSSRNSSVSYSQSGASVESFEQWSCGEHISPTSDAFSRASSVGSLHGDDTSKLRRRLNLKASGAKPPSRPADDYSSHGEEYFDCRGSSPSRHVPHSDIEDEPEPEPKPEPATRLPYKMPSPVHDTRAPSAPASPTRPASHFSPCLALPRFLSKGEPACLWVENPSWNLPSTAAEDGYRSPAYKATLELLSPSPDLMSKKSVSKVSRSSSSRRRHPHLVEVLCNSLRQSLQRCTKRSVARTQSIVLYDDQFTKRHQSFMW